MASKIGRTAESSAAKEVDLSKLKSRYDALLPKYGFLWRSMANKQMKQQPDIAKSAPFGKENNPLGVGNITREKAKVTSFLDAIQDKRPILLNIHDCDEECDCADPIVEIDEDDSVYDEGELVDSDHEDGAAAGTNETTDTVNDTNENAFVRVEIDVDTIDDSDEEIIVTGRKKSKTFVIQSDDESDLISLGDETDGSDMQKQDVANGDKLVQSVNSNESTQPDDVSSVSEKEWVELSSDEEDEAQPVLNTVVILSSDEEESEDEIDEYSVFSIGSSDSDDTAFSQVESSYRPGAKHSSNDMPGRQVKRSMTSDKIKTATETPRIRTNPTPRSMSELSSKSSSLAFRKKRDSITSSTFRTFNQLAFNNALSSVEVTWSNKLNTTAGLTRMKGRLGQPESRVATIELATKVIDNEERLRSTLLHEMCHAAAWLLDGQHKPPHGKCFKKWASISMKHITDVEVTTTHDYQIAYKYAWVSNLWLRLHKSTNLSHTDYCVALIHRHALRKPVRL
jgi:hypothetical protein